MGEYAIVKNLPAPVRAALDAVGYRRADVEVVVASTVVLAGGSGDGRRAFAALANLTTGQHTVTWGSWGGPNMFNTDNAVDLDDRPYPLPADGVAIVGSKGGSSPVWARVYISASATDRMLPGPREELTTEERDALYCYKALKSGPYRQDELLRRKVRAETIRGLIGRGLLKSNRTGAISITTEGKNALGDYRGY